MASLAVHARNQLWTQLSLVITGLLGLAFLLLEAREFADLVAEGNGPQRSAFLSSFFTLVGCHGCHVSVGLLWLGTMMAQIFAKGFTPNMQRHAFLLLPACVSGMPWTSIWVALFTVVYLIGAAR